MGQLSTEFANATRTGFSETTLDNTRNETCKMMEVEKYEMKEIDPVTIEIKVTKALKHMVKEWSTPRDVLEIRKVTKNQCCDNLLDYLFSPTGKPLHEKMAAVSKEDHKKHDNETLEKKEDTYVLTYQLPSMDSMLDK